MKSLKKLFVLTASVLTASAIATTTLSDVLAADKGEQLVIYSNSASNGRAEWLTEKAKEEGFNIQIIDIPGGELADRLIAEKNNGVADLVYGLNNLEYNKLKKEELLAKYEPTWASEVDLSLGDAEGYFYPIVIQPLVLIGKDGVEMPKDWTDLTDAKYEGKYGAFALGGGTAKTIYASIVSRYKDEAGDLGISEEGWEVAKKYIQNQYTYAQGEDYATTLLEGDKGIDYSMVWGSGLLQTEQERDYKFQVMSPEVGVPFVTEQTAIIASTKKQELAKEFIDWFGSADIQSQWSEQFGSIPANKTALENTNDTIKSFIDSVKPQELDWAFIGENLDSWVEKAELEFVK